MMTKDCNKQGSGWAAYSRFSLNKLAKNAVVSHLKRLKCAHNKPYNDCPTGPPRLQYIDS